MMNRLFSFTLCVSFALVCLTAQSAEPESRPNVLIITVDDMSADSLGAFGCKLPDTSPSIDAFARQSLRFKHAHVQVGNCMPGRNIMWSGMLSHVNGVEGFVQNRSADYPVLCDLAQAAGYFVAIRGKVSHSTPYHPYGWDDVLDTSPEGKKHHTKDARGYGESTRRGITMAGMAGKPFCLMINISDPHKPFYAQGKSGETIEDPHVPSRVFTADEVPVPGFLPDDEAIRKELAHYYSSVRRADDCFREIMQALDESGQADNTFVMFLSDHGMPLPFAKTQLYHHSTHTPLIVRWPGVTRSDSVDEKHMVSAMDFLPTLLEVMGHEHPEPQRLHGRSFVPVIRGQEQAGRDHVILQYNENSGRWRHPMRGIQTREYLYLYNPWSNGERKFTTATTGTVTYRQMVKRAVDEPDVATRLELFDHRVLEELYDVHSDPDCLVNLIGHTDHRSVHRKLRDRLAKFLADVNDPVAPLLASPHDAALREAYMAAEDERSLKARTARQKQKASGTGSSGAKAGSKKTGRLGNVIKVEFPVSVVAGHNCDVVVHHRLPESLGPQKVHVTLKAASMDHKNQLSSRIEREVRKVSGTGQIHVSFQVPDAVQSGAVRVAAFVGEDFDSHLQHLNSSPIPVKSR